MDLENRQKDTDIRIQIKLIRERAMFKSQKRSFFSESRKL